MLDPEIADELRVNGRDIVRVGDEYCMCRSPLSVQGDLDVTPTDEVVPPTTAAEHRNDPIDDVVAGRYVKPPSASTTPVMQQEQLIPESPTGDQSSHQRVDQAKKRIRRMSAFNRQPKIAHDWMLSQMEIVRRWFRQMLALLPIEPARA